MEYATGRWGINRSPEVLLTVSSSAWRYLASEMSTDEDYLVLSWSDSGWIAGVLSREFLIGVEEDALEVQLDDRYTMLIPHAEWLSQLNGRKLQCEAGALSVV